MIPYKQLSLKDIFTDCQEKFEHDKPAFLSLLETHIDIDEFIPISFRNHFYASTGRTRKYPLQFHGISYCTKKELSDFLVIRQLFYEISRSFTI